MRLRSPARLFGAALLVSGLGGCYMEVHDAKDDDTRGTFGEKTGDLNLDAERCGDETARRLPGNGAQQCFENQDFAWRTSCKKASCQPVKVFTHYMLGDDLGSGHPVHVEAFDNPNFQGAPASSVRLSHFNAKQGQWQDADLYLEPGEYYLRAYMATDEDDAAKPYQFGGMTLVQGAPVGVYGALSGAEMVRVEPRAQNPYPSPVHIYLDRQFKAPGQEPDTNAHIRLSLTLAQGYAAPDGREVKIRLHRSDDLNEAPLREFVMPSELFLVQSRLGRADYLTPSLDAGNYVVFAYLDANGNDLYDKGELQGLYKVNGQTYAVRVARDRTEPLALVLAPEGAAAPTEPQPLPQQPQQPQTGT